MQSSAALFFPTKGSMMSASAPMFVPKTLDVQVPDVVINSVKTILPEMAFDDIRESITGYRNKRVEFVFRFEEHTRFKIVMTHPAMEDLTIEDVICGYIARCNLMGIPIVDDPRRYYFKYCDFYLSLDTKVSLYDRKFIVVKVG